MLRFRIKGLSQPDLGSHQLAVSHHVIFHFCGCAASPCFLLFRPWSLPFPPRPGLCQLCQWAAGGRCQTVKWKVWESPQCENMTKISQHCEKQRPTPFTIFLLLSSHVSPSAHSHGPRPAHISAVFETASCVCRAALSPSTALNLWPRQPHLPTRTHSRTLHTSCSVRFVCLWRQRLFSFSWLTGFLHSRIHVCWKSFESHQNAVKSHRLKRPFCSSHFFFLPVAVYWSLNTFKIIHCRTLFMFQLV